MACNAAQRLKHLTDIFPAKLLALSNDDLTRQPAPGKWSRKQIIGHLIDSATNNHHRFIRTQYEEVPFISYDQNKWNSLSHYQDMNSVQLINFWAAYNLHLVAVISHIPESNLNKLCNSGDETNHTLQWLIDDYVKHLEHHLKQIIDY